MSSFTHIDDEGRVRMVDVTAKKPTVRTAVAGGAIHMNPETLILIQNHKVKKGNVLETARIAGVMAAKKTADLIPMCHPLNITHIQVDFSPDPSANSIRIEAKVRAIDQTGVGARVDGGRRRREGYRPGTLADGLFRPVRARRAVGRHGHRLA
mgnify:CR=1 FL=1